MSTPNRRQYLILAGSTVTTALAGCISDTGSEDDTEDDSDSEDDTETTPEVSETPTSTTPEVQASNGDTNLTFALEGRADDFDSLVVDIDRVEFIGQSGTDDVTVAIDDTGVDLTTLSDAKTYLDAEPFPSGTYASIDMYISVQENSLSNGGTATFDYEPPVADEDTTEISDDQYQNLTYTIGAEQPFGESTYTLSVVGTTAYGAP